MARLLGRLFVGFTLFLICSIGYTSQIFIIWPWYGREPSVDLIKLLLPFNALLALLLVNYRLCVITDPGQVPASWTPDTQSGDGYEVKKMTGSPRYCRTCGKYKPPRAHHCKTCSRCVLRMDHHCPWVNNCIGHFNHGHFIRFLFYVDLATAYHLVMVTWRVSDSMVNYWDSIEGTELIFVVINYVLCIPVFLGVGAFSLYHFWNLLGNSTTIEGWEKDKVATLIRRGSIREIKFPYNLGWRRNVASILGPSALYWCWPSTAPGTGLKYQLAEGDEHGPQASWPPCDPATREHINPDEDGGFVLPASPWTYSDGALNPALRPSNAQLRSSANESRRRKGVFAVPPYHPDYEDPPPFSSRHSSSDESEDDASSRRRLVRRGSEGYEVKSINREELLRRYITDQVQVEGRYQIYVPEADPGSESDVGASRPDETARSVTVP